VSRPTRDPDVPSLIFCRLRQSFYGLVVAKCNLYRRNHKGWTSQLRADNDEYDDILDSSDDEVEEEPRAEPGDSEFRPRSWSRPSDTPSSTSSAFHKREHSTEAMIDVKRPRSDDSVRQPGLLVILKLTPHKLAAATLGKEVVGYGVRKAASSVPDRVPARVAGRLTAESQPSSPGIVSADSMSLAEAAVATFGTGLGVRLGDDAPYETLPHTSGMNTPVGNISGKAPASCITPELSFGGTALESSQRPWSTPYPLSANSVPTEPSDAMAAVTPRSAISIKGAQDSVVAREMPSIPSFAQKERGSAGPSTIQRFPASPGL